MKTSLNSTLPNLNFTCTSPTGPRLLPFAETTFLLVGNNLTCCCMELWNLSEIALMDVPVSNNACVCKLSICILYSTWKPSMKTSLITDALGAASHAEESSESSNIIFLNSEIKLLNSLLQLSPAGVDISLICLLSWNFLWKVFIRLCCFSFVDLYFGGEPCLGAVGQSFLKCSPWQFQHLGFSDRVDSCYVPFVDGLLDL